MKFLKRFLKFYFQKMHQVEEEEELIVKYLKKILQILLLKMHHIEKEELKKISKN